MSSPCDACRFATVSLGCNVGVCATVRSSLKSKGAPVPATKCTVLCPEPMAPEGVIGLKVGARQFPPTVQGYIEARAMQGSFQRSGARLELERVFRWDKPQITGPVHLWDGRTSVLIEFWGEEVNRKAVVNG